MQARFQGFVGWTALFLVLVSVLPNGANMHVAWLGLVLATLVLFGAQMALDLSDLGRSRYVRPLWLPALLYGGVMAWAAFQLSPFAPPEWIAQSWHSVDAEGRIAVDPSHGRHLLARLIAYALIFWIALRAAADDARAAAFVRVTAVWSTLVASYGLVTSGIGYDWLAGTEARGALSATFVNRNSYATYAAFGLLANLAAVWLILAEGDGFGTTRRQRLRAWLEALTSWGWVYLTGAALVAAALMLTVSRGGIASAAVGVAVFALLLRKGDRRGEDAGGRLAWAPLAAVVVAIGGYAALTGLDALLQRVSGLSDEQARFVAFAELGEAIAEEPFIGQGLGGFQDAFRAHIPPSLAQAEWDLAHSSYLENAYELGIPAATAFFLAIALVLWRLWRGTRVRRSNRGVPAFALSVGVVGALHATVDFSLQMPAVAALFAFCLGIGWAQSFPRGKRRDGPRR